MGWLKNTLFTALMVIGATMTTAIALALLAMLGAAHGAETAIDLNTAAYGIVAAIMGAMLFGSFFSVVPLTVAAVTMPPAIGLIRAFKLPRPLFDIFGGAAAALLCAGGLGRRASRSPSGRLNGAWRRGKDRLYPQHDIADALDEGSAAGPKAPPLFVYLGSRFCARQTLLKSASSR